MAVVVRGIALVVVLPVRLAWELLAAIGRGLHRWVFAPTIRFVDRWLLRPLGWLLRHLIWVPLLWAARAASWLWRTLVWLPLAWLGDGVAWLWRTALWPPLRWCGRRLARVRAGAAEPGAAAAVVRARTGLAGVDPRPGAAVLPAVGAAGLAGPGAHPARPADPGHVEPVAVRLACRSAVVLGWAWRVAGRILWWCWALTLRPVWLAGRWLWRVAVVPVGRAVRTTWRATVTPAVRWLRRSVLEPARQATREALATLGLRR